MQDIKTENTDGGIGFIVKVVPGSSKTQIMGILDGMLKVKVSAAPEKGKANQCLVSFLAKKLALKKNAIEIISGQTNPIKHIVVRGIDSATLLERTGLESD